MIPNETAEVRPLPNLKVIMSKPRFVILEHDHPLLHWDLMLEFGSVLRTWRLPAVPTDGAMLAEQIDDHRLVYLDYEGPVSGHRGRVKCWDRGTYQLEKAEPDSITLTVHGERLRAALSMIRRSGATWRANWGCYPITAPQAPAPPVS
jgi:hypothetical protein